KLRQPNSPAIFTAFDLEDVALLERTLDGHACQRTTVMVAQRMVEDKPPLDRDGRELTPDRGAEGRPVLSGDAGHRSPEGDGLVEVVLRQRGAGTAFPCRGHRARLPPASRHLAGPVVARPADWRVEQRDAVGFTE